MRYHLLIRSRLPISRPAFTRTAKGDPHASSRTRHIHRERSSAHPRPAEGLSRFSIDKQIHGDLEATTKGEMFSGGDPRQGAAGYVAIEVVTGTLNGKHGSFALQHFGHHGSKRPKMQVIVVPGSGTGELKGIAGAFTIKIENGQHSYDFDYSLP